MQDLALQLFFGGFGALGGLVILDSRFLGLEDICGYFEPRVKIRYDPLKP